MQAGRLNDASSTTPTALLLMTVVVVVLLLLATPFSQLRPPHNVAHLSGRNVAQSDPYRRGSLFNEYVLQTTVAPARTTRGLRLSPPPPRGRTVSTLAVREWELTGEYKRSASEHAEEGGQQS